MVSAEVATKESFKEGGAVALQMLRGSFSQVWSRAGESMKGLVGNEGWSGPPLHGS